MTGRLRRLIAALNSEKRGITGLETAIILIAFVVVASVFAYTILSAGIWSSQKAQETLYYGMKSAGGGLETRGSVVAVGNSTTQTVDFVIFTLGTTLSGAIDFTPPTDLDGDHLPDPDSQHITCIQYHSSQEVCYDLTYDTQLKGWGDGDYILETGEKFEVTVDLRGLLYPLRPYDTISLTVKPPTGSVMQIQRTLPSDIGQVICLY